MKKDETDYTPHLAVGIAMFVVAVALAILLGAIEAGRHEATRPQEARIFVPDFLPPDSLQSAP